MKVENIKNLTPSEIRSEFAKCEFRRKQTCYAPARKKEAALGLALIWEYQDRLMSGDADGPIDSVKIYAY